MYTKKQLEDILHRRLLWHEYADKGTYLAGDKFDGGDPIEIIVHYDPDKVERCHVKCAGVSEMLPLARFASGAQCSKCLERATPSMYACSSVNDAFYACDLTSDFDDKSSIGTMVAVPAGCPHATSDPVVSDDDRHEYKYWASTVSGPKHAKRAVPYSWKIVETKDKLTLSIQYRVRYLDGKNMDTVCSSMYCHISCNLRTGMTYMSDIHSAKGHLRSASYTNRMETLTFSKEMHLLLHMPDYQKLKEPLSTLYDLLGKRLRERRFDCDGVVSEPIGEGWDVSGPSDAKFKSVEDLLHDIAVLNRFPNLGQYPLPLVWRPIVSLYLRRRFDHLPREVDADTLATALALPDTPHLRALVKKDPMNALFAVMLGEWGFPDEDIEKLSMKGFSSVVAALSHIVPNQNKHARDYEMFDMLSVAVPVHLLYGTKRYEPINDSFNLLFGGNSTDVVAQKISETMDDTLLKPFQKLGSRWAGSCLGTSFSWMPHRGSISSIVLSSRDEELAELSVAMTMYLDRRAWNKKEARKLVEWLKSMDSSPQSQATEELGEHVRSTFLRAMRFSSELLYVRSLPSDAYSERECKIVYEWAHKNGVEVNLNVDGEYDAAKSVRRSIEKRVEKKRKAKRDAKAQE